MVYICWNSYVINLFNIVLRKYSNNNEVNDFPLDITQSNEDNRVTMEDGVMVTKPNQWQVSDSVRKTKQAEESADSDTVMSFDEDDNFDDHLQDAIVKEALESRQDLRDYSKQIEKELLDCEQVSIQVRRLNW